MGAVKQDGLQAAALRDAPGIGVGLDGLAARLAAQHGEAIAGTRAIATPAAFHTADAASRRTTDARWARRCTRRCAPSEHIAAGDPPPARARRARRRHLDAAMSGHRGPHRPRRHPMRLTPEQIAEFDREGYLFFPGLFTPEETKTC